MLFVFTLCLFLPLTGGGNKTKMNENHVGSAAGCLHSTADRGMGCMALPTRGCIGIGSAGCAGISLVENNRGREGWMGNGLPFQA